MDGAPLLNELLYGGRLPEGVDDGAAREGNVGAVRAVCDEWGAGDVDVAESAAALLYGAHHDGREDAAVQDGEDDVAAACEEARGVPADEADLLSYGRACRPSCLPLARRTDTRK